MKLGILGITFLLLFGCQSKNATHQKSTTALNADTMTSCSSNLPDRFPATAHKVDDIADSTKAALDDMVLIPAGSFMMGGDSKWGRPDEFPHHPVTLSSFYMDKHEVTNAQFRAFVKATGYVTTAELKPDWNEIKKQVPPGTPKPADSLLVAASLVFTKTDHPVPLNNPAVWWRWVPGADWRHPQGPGSSIEGKDKFPVVQVSWQDAAAYAKWAGKRLPIEAEWEYAARGGQKDAIYPWGTELVNQGKPKANTWDGHFPNQNSAKDGYRLTAPVEQFAPNGYGLYDMAGNVWEWCNDWYRSDYYQTCLDKGIVDNPQGPADSYDPDEPYARKKVTRGGSFLCNDQYCSGFRVSARMKTTWDTSLNHTGFRCVVSAK